MTHQDFKRFIRQTIKTIDAIATLTTLIKSEQDVQQIDYSLLARLDAASIYVTSVLNDVIEKHAQS